jgi:hypothetical protein
MAGPNGEEQVPQNNAAHAAAELNTPITKGQAAMLFDAVLQKSNDQLQPLVHQVAQLQHVLAQQQAHAPASSSSDPFATIKRKAETITNEGLKKQYEPLEETKLRVDAVSETMKEAVENQRGLSFEETVALQKTLQTDEGSSVLSRRVSHLEIAIAEGWDVAKQFEKNTFMMELPEDMQKQLKRARKDAKAAEEEKKAKSRGSHAGNRRGYFFRRGRGGGFGGRGGFHGGNRGGFGGGAFHRGGPRACYTCNQVGHLSANCPQRGFQAAMAGRQMH